MKLYIFGCSYSEDFENVPKFITDNLKSAQIRYVEEFLMGITPPTWSKVLSEFLNCDRINSAVGGSSNPHIFENVCRYSSEFKKGDIVIVQWTKNSRFRWPSRGGWIPMLPSNFNKNDKISLTTFEETIVARSHRLFREEIYMYQNLINSLSDAVKFNVYYFAMDEKLLVDLPQNNRHLLSQYFIYEKKIGISEIFNKNGVITISQETNNKISDGHFGKIGHQKIGELFYEHIKNDLK
jgi:hypothetical protein